MFLVLGLSERPTDAVVTDEREGYAMNLRHDLDAELEDLVSCYLAAACKSSPNGVARSAVAFV